MKVSINDPQKIYDLLKITEEQDEDSDSQTVAMRGWINMPIGVIQMGNAQEIPTQFGGKPAYLAEPLDVAVFQAQRCGEHYAAVIRIKANSRYEGIIGGLEEGIGEDIFQFLTGDREGEMRGYFMHKEEPLIAVYAQQEALPEIGKIKSLGKRFLGGNKDSRSPINANHQFVIGTMGTIPREFEQESFINDLSVLEKVTNVYIGALYTLAMDQGLIQDVPNITVNLRNI